jgi:hypothetical protein
MSQYQHTQNYSLKYKHSYIARQEQGCSHLEFATYMYCYKSTPQSAYSVWSFSMVTLYMSHKNIFKWNHIIFKKILLP